MKPLVSCICITQNRRLFLRQAVDYFKSAWQIYDGEAELVILDGSEHSSEEALADDLWLDSERMRYFHEPSPPHAKTGALHNRACELARGDIIIQWDDDDWQSPDRIVKQVAALQSLASPGFVYTSQFYGYHLTERRASRSRCWEAGGGSMGTTFAYHRKLWEQIPFRDVDQAEDSFFWDDVHASGAPNLDMRDPELVLYIRHNRNGSPTTLEPSSDWDTGIVRKLMVTDIDFYDELSEILPLDEWNNPHARWHEQMNRADILRAARLIAARRR